MSHTNTGHISVISALVGNTIIAISKFVGFFLTGSSALFAEGIHSLADTLNQALLFVGIKRSQKEANKNFRFGFGIERFFWALISACGIFFLGAGVTIYHGIESLLHKEEISFSWIAVSILIIAIIIETVTFLVAYRELFNTKVKKNNFLKTLRHGDPATIAVLLEDFVAVLGSLIAVLSIFLTSLTGNYIYDAIASITIGLLLAAVALVLIIKNWEYLVGKSLPDEIIEEIKEILNQDPAIEKVIDIMSSVVDVNRYHVVCEVELNGASLVRDYVKDGSLREEYEEVKDDYNQFLKMFIDISDRMPRLIGTHINYLGKKIEEKFDEVAQVDIEIS